MLHVDRGFCLGLGFQGHTKTCCVSIIPVDMRGQQASRLKWGLRWAWRCAHAHSMEVFTMHSGASLLDRCLPARHARRGLSCTEGRRCFTGYVQAASGRQPSHGSTLLLVESPAKAKKLQQFLGDEYKVQLLLNILALACIIILGSHTVQLSLVPG